MKALNNCLKTNEKRVWIQPSTSPAGAPIHFMKNKDDNLHLCDDYRR